MGRFFITVYVLFSVHFSSVGQCFAYSSTKCSPAVSEEVKFIKKAKQLESQRVGISGLSDVYPHFEKLVQVASEDELVSFTNDKNPILRCYAFWALCTKKTLKKKLLSVLVKHLCDTMRVETQFGCIGGSRPVGDFMLDEMRYDSAYELDRQELKQIDSLLFWTPNNRLNRRKTVIGQTEANEQNYARLKTLFLQENAAEALLPILSMKKEEDVDLIAALLKKDPETTFEAIRFYPDKRFESLLKNWLDKNHTNYLEVRWINFYEAVIAYNNAFTFEILKKPFSYSKKEPYNTGTTARQHHVRNIYACLKDVKDKKYDSLKVATLQYIDDMESYFFEYIWNVDSAKCLKIIENRLTTEEHPFWRDSILHKMANKIVSCEKDNAVNVINGVLKKGWSYSFIVFSKYANKIYNRETVDIVKTRFLNEKAGEFSGIDYRIAGILAFDNKDLYREIADHAFSLAELKEVQSMNVSLRDYDKLLLKIDRERMAKLFLKDLQELKKKDDFVIWELNCLITLKDPEINKQMVQTYEQYPDKNSEIANRVKYILRGSKLY